MGALINLSLRVDKLPKEKFVQGKDGAVYYNFTIGVNDESNQWGQNVSATDSQTKEEREAKKPKSYLSGFRWLKLEFMNTKNNFQIKILHVAILLSFTRLPFDDRLSSSDRVNLEKIFERRRMVVLNVVQG